MSLCFASYIVSIDVVLHLEALLLSHIDCSVVITNAHIGYFDAAGLGYLNDLH